MKRILEEIIDRNTEGNYLLSSSDKAQMISEILGLFGVSLSLLRVAKCPNGNCDNNGTIANQEYPSGEWIPEPCEWCHRKKEILNNEG